MITFDHSAAGFILATFGYSTDNDGYIVDDKLQQRVLASDGKEIRLEELAGVLPGVKLVRNDLISLIKLSDHLDRPAAKA